MNRNRIDQTRAHIARIGALLFERRLTDAAGPDTLPTWTPDGRIVFRSARTGS